MKFLGVWQKNGLPSLGRDKESCSKSGFGIVVVVLASRKPSIPFVLADDFVADQTAGKQLFDIYEMILTSH